MKRDAVTEYIGQFNDLLDSLPGAEIQWLKQARREAMENFTQAGFPGRGKEERK